MRLWISWQQAHRQHDQVGKILVTMVNFKPLLTQNSANNGQIDKQYGVETDKSWYVT